MGLTSFDFESSFLASDFRFLLLPSRDSLRLELDLRVFDFESGVDFSESRRRFRPDDLDSFEVIDFDVGPFEFGTE